MLVRASKVLLLTVGLAAMQGCAAPVQPASAAADGDDGGAPAQDDAGDEPSVDAGPEAAPYPAIAPFAVQVPNAGGEVVGHARVVPVFFPGQPDSAALTDFFTKYLGSSVWEQATTQYGVGAATAASAVQPTDALPSSMSTDDLNAWLTSELDGTHAVWGPTDPATVASSVYVLFVPPSTTLLAPGNDASDGYAPSLCGGRPWDPTGWHWQTTPTSAPGTTGGAGPPIVYAVVGACPTPGVAPLDGLTGTLSHELVEVTTDPLFLTAPAYWTVDQAHAFWVELTGGGELADLCVQEQTPFIRPPEIGYLVQRTWSNAAASAGHAPCIPAIAAAYFDVQADAPDWLLDPYVGEVVKGVAIPAGQSRTIDVRLFSDAPTAAWQVRAIDPSASQGGPPLLDLSLDHGSGQNGDVLHLTIRPLFDEVGVTALYELDSTQQGTTEAWYGEIVVK